MKKVLGLLAVVFMVGCVGLNEAQSPVTITETITKDSTGKEVHVITKTYSNGTTQVVPQASFNFVTHPGWDNFYGAPYYYSQPYFVPRIVVPINPNMHYRQSGRGRH
jgi:hypothetical protein